MKKNRFVSQILAVLILVSCFTPLSTIKTKAASILTVGPGKMYATPQEAFDAASPGDIIEIDAEGVYYGTDAHLAISGKDNLTIRGVNGLARMIANPAIRITWGKAIWVINAANITIENIEFQDAACVDKNGAGIRMDPGAQGTITIRNCFFHDNENGILTSAPSGDPVNLIIESCEFYSNGRGDGQTHNMYIGGKTNFTLRYTHSHHVKQGHLVKSRAITNFIEYNRITDEDTNSTYNSNYNIDLPDGGTSYIIGNILHQGTTAPNNCMIAYALENTNAPGKNCYIINNTIVNDASYATLFRARNSADYKVVYKNNIITGAGATNSGGSTVWEASNNYRYTASSDPGFFTNKANYDYTLTEAAVDVIDKGIDPGYGDGYPLAPTKQYAHRCGYVDRVTTGDAIDIGAYEYGAVLPVPSPAPSIKPKPTPSPMPTSPAGTWYSKADWNSGIYYIGHENTGIVEINFDATPLLDNNDATIGYADSSTIITHWSGCPVIVRFNAQGTIDARNGGDYAALVTVPYTANTTYHFKLIVNIPGKDYDVWVTPEGGEEILLAESFAFRTDAPATDDLGKLSLKTNGDNQLTVENHVIAPGPSPTPSPTPTPTPTPTPRFTPMTLTVGPGKMFRNFPDAVNYAIEGDIIEIDASGVYYGVDAMAAITKNNLIIRGVNGRPKMQAQPGLRPTWGKALWVINASDITIENIEFQDTTCEDHNGAGIKVDPGAGGTVLIKNCYFHNNENGILTAAPTGDSVDLIIENCEFAENGRGDGYTHNIYIGGNTNFTLRYSYSHRVKNGQLVKSRAATNKIEYNRITDEETNSTYCSNYNIDLPDGGTSYIIGNILHQGTTAPNNCVIAYALESSSRPGKNCYIINNTIVNDASYATMIRARDSADHSVTYINNIFVGAGALRNTGAYTWVASNNYRNENPDPGLFVDKEEYDYHLVPTALDVIDKGIDPGTGDGYNLAPVMQYSYDLAGEQRTVLGAAIDIGAFEFDGIMASPSPSPTPTPSPLLLSGGMPVSASKEQPGYPATLGNDGNDNTRWASGQPSFPQWWQVDLGSEKYITNVDINWKTSSAIYYEILLSDDNVNFTTVVDNTGNTNKNSTSDPINAIGRYVRVYMTGSGGSWASFYECRVYGFDESPVEPTPSPTPTLSPTPSPLLLSGGMTVSASKEQPGYPATLGNDGNDNTRWASGQPSFPQWWQVDLGSEKYITNVDINWKTSSAIYYTIQLSDDNVNFTTVVDNTGNTNKNSTSDPINAMGRYVRIYMTGSGGSWASFYECRVYGFD